MKNILIDYINIFKYIIINKRIINLFIIYLHIIFKYLFIIIIFIIFIILNNYLYIFFGIIISLHPLNISFLLVTFDVFQLEISGNEFNELHS